MNQFRQAKVQTATHPNLIDSPRTYQRCQSENPYLVAQINYLFPITDYCKRDLDDYTGHSNYRK